MIYLYTGENNYAIRTQLAERTDAFVAAHGRDALERREGESLERGQLDSLFAGGTLFAPQRMIVISNPAAQKSIWEALPEHLERAADDSEIVFIQQPIDKRTKTYKWLQSHATIVQCDPMPDTQLQTWVVKEAERAGTTLSPKLAGVLLRKVGTDQWMLHNEIAKLALATNEITIEHIDDIVEATPQSSAFDLLDAAVAKNPAKVSAILADLRMSEDAYRFMGLLYSQVYALGAAYLAHRSSVSAEAAAKQLGLHPFVVKKSMATAKQITHQEMGEMIDACADADRLIKTSGAEPWQVIGSYLHKVAARTTS